MEKAILEVKNLKTYFASDNGTVKAADDVSFNVYPEETLGIVGESGCGKSITCLSVMRLVETPPGKYVGGEILFEGKNLLEVSEKEIIDVRGNSISMIFQEPMTSLNPVFRVADQIAEALTTHRKIGKIEARKEAVEMLRKVGIPNPERVARDYPFALSGGMRQRVMIAMALACRPKILIADEPTTALDVTIQAQVLDLINKLKHDYKTSIIFITHDLGVIAEMADRVMVMYAGKVVEMAPAETLFNRPKHPYTKGLMRSKPDMTTEGDRLHVIPGNVPNLNNRPDGCAFHPRCENCMERCKHETPELQFLEDGCKVACWLFADKPSEDLNKKKEGSQA